MLNQLQPILSQAAKHKKGRKAKVRPIFVSKQLELKYAKALHGFIDEMHKETLNQLLMQNMGDSKTVADSLLDRFLAILNHLKTLFLVKVSDIATPLASMIVKAQQKASDKQLGELLKKQIGLDFDGLMRDEDLAEAINEAIHANVSLIKSIPQAYFDKIEKAVLSSIQSGTLNRDLAKQLESIESTTKSRANLIATDQLGKINSRISQIRQQKLGITHYTWSTSRDERVRHSHRLRDGQIFAWDNPPDDGHAGQAIRCRCVAIPYTEHLMGGKSPDEVMAEQKQSVDNTIKAEQHIAQSVKLLNRKSSNGGLKASDLLSNLQTDKQGNPALRLSQALYDELQNKLGDAPPIWAVNHYTIHSKHINDLLRGKVVADEFLQASQNALDGLDKLFANELATVKTPFTVWRGQSMLIQDVDLMQQMLFEGRSVKYGDLAFRSTSLNPNLAKEFSSRNIKDGKAPVVFKINVTQGMKALDISSYHFYTGDNEILLNRGSVMNIKQITKNADGSFEIEADVEMLENQTSDKIADKKPKIVYIDDSEVEDDPRYGKWSSTGFLIFG